MSVRRIGNALNVQINPATGLPACTAVINNSDPTCVPWNIFAIGGVTPAAVAYISAPGLQRGQVKQSGVDVNFTGDFGKYGVQMPHTSSGLKINVGGDWLDVRSFFEPDAEFQSGDLSGQGGQILPVGGGIVAREAYMEARMPLVEHLPGVQALDAEMGYRYSDYSLGFKTNTFKFGLDWKPVEDVRLRASFARAVRAPNIGELFSASSVNLDGNVDPCAGPAVNGLVNGFTAAQCAQTGVSAAQFGNITPNSAAQYNGLTGGNPALQPETALTSSFGIGWTPSFIPNFRAQIDYYDIKIENTIKTVGANTIVNDCVNNDLFCGLIHRDVNGSLWLSTNGYVIDTTSNVGQLEERGLDLDLSYSVNIGPLGRLQAALVGTYLDRYAVTSIAAIPSTSYNCVGYYGLKCSDFSAGAGAPVSRWRHQMRFTWLTPWSGLDLAMTWRYYSPVLLESFSQNPNLAAASGATVANGGISNTDAHISSYSYLDLTGAVHLADHVTVRVGVNNVLDKDPPVIGQSNLPSITGNGNTFPGSYDTLGRYIFGQLTVQF